jgi:pimeloyl-ACP methyl ester carboxylesterase
MNTDPDFHLLPDGRRLAFSEYGDPQGFPIVYAHGSPGSRLEGAIFHDTAVRMGFRLIAMDRPGMGQSSNLAGRRLLDYPEDIRSLADALHLDTFGTVGWSGGGIHAAACAYALPDRVAFTALLCGYTNFAELENAASYLELKADQIAAGLGQQGSPLFNLFFWLLAANIRLVPGLFIKTLASSLPPNDQAILADPAVQAHVLADQQEAFAHGWRGCAVDAQIHYLDWGFRIRAIPGKLTIFHGTDDKSVPLAYSRHLAAEAQDSELIVLPGEGHFFPVTHQEMIFKAAREAAQA